MFTPADVLFVIKGKISYECSLIILFEDTLIDVDNSFRGNGHINTTYVIKMYTYSLSIEVPINNLV